MPLHFRKSIVIVPGVHINFNETGISLSVGLPGSGVSYREGVNYSTLVSAFVPTSGASAPTPVSPPAEEKVYSLWFSLSVIVCGGVLAAAVGLVCAHYFGLIVR